MKIKKNTFLISAIVILVVASFFFLSGSNLKNNKITGNAINNEEIQVVKLWVESGNYVLEPSNLKKDVPVVLEADVTKMPGCSKSIIISEFNVRKNFNSKDNSVKFIPNKAGTFYIACSMNMYKGTFTVLENDGSKSNYVQPLAAPSGGSCGAGGGGCGCGG